VRLLRICRDQWIPGVFHAEQLSSPTASGCNQVDCEVEFWKQMEPDGTRWNQMKGFRGRRDQSIQPELVDSDGHKPSIRSAPGVPRGSRRGSCPRPSGCRNVGCAPGRRLWQRRNPATVARNPCASSGRSLPKISRRQRATLHLQPGLWPRTDRTVSH
jgi:hypothetical protein